ncbi:hypothetical protein [uncultured Microscilla sp.]|uniref:hypothetical protein n=1 Tax=uncultured Microscilla sp. TaxID=432653 RepID=UPI002615489C|nr:hypothetical protein [uncultured Microscilla sp.]
MAQYIPFEEGIEVNGQTVLSFINALPMFRDDMLEILAKHGISNPKEGEWYPQLAWLNAFKEIGEKYGANTLFAIGKAIPENADFPPDIDNLEKALGAIDVAYHMNHTKGNIGHYTLVKFNEEDKIAIMECRNPYPSNFDRGIITTMARKFKPPSVLMIAVELDTSKPSRLDGAEQCTYRITW